MGKSRPCPSRVRKNPGFNAKSRARRLVLQRSGYVKPPVIKVPHVEHKYAADVPAENYQTHDSFLSANVKLEPAEVSSCSFQSELLDTGVASEAEVETETSTYPLQINNLSDMLEVQLDTPDVDEDPVFNGIRNKCTYDKFNRDDQKLTRTLNKMYEEQCRANCKTEEYRAKKLKLLEEQAKYQCESMKFHQQIAETLKTTILTNIWKCQ